MTGKLITDLGYGQCKYPTTSFEATKHYFCGEPVEYDKCPYCAVHAALCFDRRPSERKRADRERTAIMRAMRVRPVMPPANTTKGAHTEDAFGRDS